MRLFSSTHSLAFGCDGDMKVNEQSLCLRVHIGQTRSSIVFFRLTWILNFGLVWWQPCSIIGIYF